MIGFPDPLPLAKTYSYSICCNLTWNNSKNCVLEQIAAAVQVQVHTMWLKCFKSSLSFPLNPSRTSHFLQHTVFALKISQGVSYKRYISSMEGLVSMKSDSLHSIFLVFSFIFFLIPLSLLFFLFFLLVFLAAAVHLLLLLLLLAMLR